MFYVVSGLTMLVASVLAGLLWDVRGAPATFMMGAAFSAATLALLWLGRMEIT